MKVIDSTESRPPELFGSRIVAILFADAIGFSKLGETEVPRFIEHFLGAVARWSEKFAESILTQNTWGDAIYFVFSDVDSAGKFALAVADLAASTDWPAKRLARRLESAHRASCRTGLRVHGPDH